MLKTPIQSRKLGDKVEILSDPLRVDVLNNGLDTIVIGKLFIDGVMDNSYLIDGASSSDIVIDQVVQITPSISGSEIKIITENKKEFEFGS